jgi:hypothetical protein
MKKTVRRSKGPAHDTPTLGPRRRATKVKPMPPRARPGGDYDPGVPRPKTSSPSVDEGEPEVNG